MNRERLQHLITILEKVQPDMLKMGGWFARLTPCGTAACAVGHACLDPDFQAQGLSPFFGGPKYAGDMGWDAVEGFFDLGPLGAEHLFDEDSYSRRIPVTPADVIERIREMLAGDPT